MDRTEELLKELTEAVGVSGFEDEVADLMVKHLSPLCEISRDRLGSVIGKKEGKKDGPRIMLAGHMDEIGFMVKSITKEGFIKFLPLGGWWGHVVLAQRVMVRTRKGDIVGVTGSKAPHVLTQEERGKVVEIKDMYIDVGVSGKFNVEKRLGVRPGDPIIPISPFTILGNKKAYLAKAWDDRVGCAMIIDVMEKFKRAKHNNIIFGVGTVQEEVGLRGARTSSAVVDPDVAFALEVSIAHDTPGMDSTGGEKLGNGAGILVYDGSMIPNFRLRDHVINVAEKKKIPYHLCALERGGTDSGIIHLNKRGVPSLVIGVPTRYIHGHVGILDRGDYNNCVKLLVEVIKTLDDKTVKSFTA